MRKPRFTERTRYENGQKVWHLLPVFTPEPDLTQVRFSSEAQDCGGGAWQYPMTARGRLTQTQTQNIFASQIAGNAAQAICENSYPAPRFE